MGMTPQPVPAAPGTAPQHAAKTPACIPSKVSPPAVSELLPEDMRRIAQKEARKVMICFRRYLESDVYIEAVGSQIMSVEFTHTVSAKVLS